MHPLLAELVSRRGWDTVDLLIQNGVTLPQLWDAWRANDLQGMINRLADLDLATPACSVMAQ
jgi:hypothetical protein